MPLYEEIEIEDMIYNRKTLMFTYPCPCGDQFQISLEDLWDGEDVADCQSCTLFIKVVYEEENLPELPDDTDDELDTENGSRDTVGSSETSNPQVTNENKEVDIADHFEATLSL